MTSLWRRIPDHSWSATPVPSKNNSSSSSFVPRFYFDCTFKLHAFCPKRQLILHKSSMFLRLTKTVLILFVFFTEHRPPTVSLRVRRIGGKPNEFTPLSIKINESIEIFCSFYRRSLLVIPTMTGKIWLQQCFVFCFRIILLLTATYGNPVFWETIFRYNVTYGNAGGAHAKYRLPSVTEDDLNSTITCKAGLDSKSIRLSDVRKLSRDTLWSNRR